MNEQHDSDPMVLLAPDDARTVRAAGVGFARTLAGAPSAAFLMAVDEQGELIRAAIRRAGYPKRQARRTATEFQGAAMGEWQRIASTAQPETWGSA